MDVKSFLIAQGLTAEEIAAMPEKQQKVFATALGKYDEGTTALTKSAADLELARGEHEEAAKFWEDKVTPALAGMDRKVAESTSEIARYKAYLQSLKTAGYDVPEALLAASVANPVIPVRDPESGKYVTPDQMAKEFSATGPTLIALTQLSNEYSDLYAAPYLTMEQDFAEAQKARQPFRDFVRTKYKFSDKRSEREQAKVQKDKDEYAATKVAEARKEMAEKMGNPDLASPRPSKFDKIEKMAERKDSWKTNAGREAGRKDRLSRFANVTLN